MNQEVRVFYQANFMSVNRKALLIQHVNVYKQMKGHYRLGKKIIGRPAPISLKQTEQHALDFNIERIQQMARDQVAQVFGIPPEEIKIQK
jgi:hypothetical protein